MESNKDASQNSSEQLVRRRLLKAAVYTPPVILGSMIAAPTTAGAVTVILPGGSYNVSTVSSACPPCDRLIAGTGTPRDSTDCLKRQCTNLCINCDTFVANAAAYGKTTCSKCAKVLNSGCALPAVQCAGCTCTDKNAGKPGKKPKWSCV